MTKTKKTTKAKPKKSKSYLSKTKTLRKKRPSKPRSTQKKKTKKGPSFNQIKSKTSIILVCLLILAFLSGLGAHFILKFVQNKVTSRSSFPTSTLPQNLTKSNKTNQTLTKIKQQVVKTNNPKSSPNYHQFEEKITSLPSQLNTHINQIDIILMQLLYLFPQAKIATYTSKDLKKNSYHYKFQKIVINLDAKNKFIKKLWKDVRQTSPFAQVKKISPSTYAIYTDGVLTHKLILQSKPNLPPTSYPYQLAIVIDDIGRSLRQAKQLLALPIPITLSLLPYAPYTPKIVQFARRTKHSVMLHLPMEPEGYPLKANPGPGAIFTFMSPQEIRWQLKQDLAMVPTAIGVNNHMGSKFTAYKKGMEIVLTELKKRNLFFLDSLTTPKSLAKQIALQKKLPYIQRHIFLDNVPEKKYILTQLHKAELLAIQKKRVIAIGHPYPQTIATLQFWSSHRNHKVKVVPIISFLYDNNK